MGLLRKNKSNKKDRTSYYDTAKQLGGVHEIIANLWGKESVKRVIEDSKKDIDTIIDEEGVNRKTDLLEYGLELCLELLSNAKKNSQTTLGTNCITAFIYYRIFFECVLSLDTDIVQVNEWYAVFQATGVIDSRMHPYMQLMIKTYDLLDRGITYLYTHMDSITEDYFTIVAKKIRNSLNAYTDDNSDWNKILR